MAHSIKNSSAPRSAEGGFTLVELSIVLVIIGLIVGAVLVGQDLIRAAETRAIITQIERYNTAVNTFTLKYGILAGDAAIPGDDSDIVQGNNDGLLSEDNDTVEAAPTKITGEIPVFWQQLSYAGFIDGSFSGESTNTVLSSGTVATGTTSNFPATKSNRGGIIAYGMPDGMNYYHIGLKNHDGSEIKTFDNLRPEEAFNIDKKVDDANPITGSVLARGGNKLEKDPSEKSKDTGCADTKNAVYNLEAVAPSCQLRMRFN